MKISKIEPQKKNKKRFSIYIDGAYRFGLNAEIVLKYDLHEGDGISEEEIQNILIQEEKLKIKQRALRILNYRCRSVQEIRLRLLNLGFDDFLVDQVIDDLVAADMLNDERFANAFINDYTKVKPRGNKFIFSQLRKHGITKEIINRLLGMRNEKELIENFIHRKLKNLNPQDPKQRLKIIRRLLNRGFSSDKIYDALSNLYKNESF